MNSSGIGQAKQYVQPGCAIPMRTNLLNYRPAGYYGTLGNMGQSNIMAKKVFLGKNVMLTHHPMWKGVSVTIRSGVPC